VVQALATKKIFVIYLEFKQTSLASRLHRGIATLNRRESCSLISVVQASAIKEDFHDLFRI
jgi:hypothetical protein